jgi:hypothetical protein
MSNRLEESKSILKQEAQANSLISGRGAREFTIKVWFPPDLVRELAAQAADHSMRIRLRLKQESEMDYVARQVATQILALTQDEQEIKEKQQLSPDEIKDLQEGFTQAFSEELKEETDGRSSSQATDPEGPTVIDIDPT